MLDWLETLIPAGDFTFIAQVAAYAILLCVIMLVLSMFCGIFSAIFRR